MGQDTGALAWFADQLQGGLERKPAWAWAALSLGGLGGCRGSRASCGEGQKVASLTAGIGLLDGGRPLSALNPFVVAQQRGLHLGTGFDYRFRLRVWTTSFVHTPQWCVCVWVSAWAAG